MSLALAKDARYSMSAALNGEYARQNELGNTLAVMNENIRQQLSYLGTIHGFALENTQNLALRDTWNMTLDFTVNADIQSDELGSAILRGANFHVHRGSIPASAVFASFDSDWILGYPRGHMGDVSDVIDEDSLRAVPAGTPEGVPPPLTSPNAVGRALGAFGTVHSSDPTRDNRIAGGINQQGGIGWAMLSNIAIGGVVLLIGAAIGFVMWRAIIHHETGV